MEEILASIRRIIAEGEQDVREGVQPNPRPAESRSAADAEILILTEMLQEDGSVVSLEPESTQADAASTNADDHEQAAGSASPASFDPEKVGSATAAGPASAEIGPAGPMGPDAGKRAASIQSGPPSRSSPAHDRASKEAARSNVSGEGLKKPDLMSEEALAASTAALAQLAQSVGRPRELPAGASRTVDDLVREAVEPLLRQWLDAHLPRIVERMVREAIDRVVHRVD